VIRNAGGRVTEAVINDIAFISDVARTMIPDGPLFEVAVVHHTGCGTGFLADAAFRSALAARTGMDEAVRAAEAVVAPTAIVAPRAGAAQSRFHQAGIVLSADGLAERRTLEEPHGTSWRRGGSQAQLAGWRRPCMQRVANTGILLAGTTHYRGG
jgi:hypothetical protein